MACGDTVPMISRTRLRTALTAFGLYLAASALIGYFGVNAYTGAHGLKAKQDLAIQRETLSNELAKLTIDREQWQHRVSLLKTDAVDPDLLDERARAMLDYVHPHDLVLMLKPR